MRIVEWPNKMGCDVFAGKTLHFEVWKHGGVTRCVADDSLVGYYGTHFTRVPLGTWEEMGRAAVQSWRSDKDLWEPCKGTV